MMDGFMDDPIEFVACLVSFLAGVGARDVWSRYIKPFVGGLRKRGTSRHGYTYGQ